MQEIFRKNVKYKVGRLKYESKENNRKFGIRVCIRKPLRKEYNLD
jgi:hypothetical protein